MKRVITATLLASLAATGASAEPAACENARAALREAYDEVAAEEGLPLWDDLAQAGFNLSGKMTVAMAGSNMSGMEDMTIGELDADLDRTIRLLQLNTAMRALDCEWR